MDSSYDELESSSVMDELSIVKDQLVTYQRINGDLSKKTQDLKIQLNAANKELVSTRNELMNEKLKSSELRRILMVLTGQCTHFFNGFYTNIQQSMVTTDLDITMPPEFYPLQTHDVASTSSGVVFRPYSRAKAPSMVDPNVVNCLNTICEETDENNSMIAPHKTSTPLTVLREIQNFAPPMSAIEESTDMDSVESISETPKRLSEGPRMATRRLSPDESVIECSRAGSISALPPADVTSPVDAEEERSDSDVRAKDPKPCSVDLTRIEASPTLVEQYKITFQSAPEEVDLKAPETSSSAEQMQMDSEGNKEAISSDADETTSNTSSTATQAARKRKTRKPKDVEPRRSNGRVRRKARLAVGTLAEHRLNQKLRRSK